MGSLRMAVAAAGATARTGSGASTEGRLSSGISTSSAEGMFSTACTPPKALFLTVTCMP